MIYVSVAVNHPTGRRGRQSIFRKRTNFYAFRKYINRLRSKYVSTELEKKHRDRGLFVLFFFCCFYLVGAFGGGIYLFIFSFEIPSLRAKPNRRVNRRTWLKIVFFFLSVSFLSTTRISRAERISGFGRRPPEKVYDLRSRLLRSRRFVQTTTETRCRVTRCGFVIIVTEHACSVACDVRAD